MSLLQFLLQLHLYTNQLTPPFEIYTYSQSLIATISKLSKWTLHFPSTTLQPEWDTLQAITTTLQKLHMRPTLTHVKSHKDNQQDYATLPLHVKLNVNADKLAGDYHAHTPYNTTTAPLIQGTTAQLTSPLGTITTKLPQTI